MRRINVSRELFREHLRNRIATEEFDYQTLLDALREYAHPRDKITSLLRDALIIRVKKGLYIFGDAFRRRPISRELLANLIYGPSYISLEYALSIHGLIPERVETVTSVVYGRSRIFNTPAGRFTYRRIRPEAYSVGMARIEAEGGVAYLAASPEKALADLIVSDRGTKLASGRAMESYLLDHLRIDGDELHRFDAALVLTIARRYRSRKIRILAEFLTERTSQDRETRHE
jgi:hypothetical protein